MKLTTVFQISMLVLASFAAVILAVAEGAVWPEGLTLPLAILVYFFVERWRTWRLPLFWANLLGFVAFATAGIEFFAENLEARLLSGAHLLVYLTWITLFQEKQARQYWWLSALALLQIAVASVLTTAAWFGSAFSLFILCAIWTFSVFSMREAERRYSRSRHFATSRAGVSVPVVPSLALAIGRTSQMALAVTVAEDRARYSSMTRGSIQHGLREEWISKRFIWGVFTTTVLAMLVGWVFFLLIPRVWVGGRSIFSDEPIESVRPLTGFTEKVTLGDMGQILESTERVLTVRMRDSKTDESIDVEEYAAALGYDEPMFRGAVLGTYENGKWSRGYREGGLRLLRRDPRQSAIAQEIELAPIGTDMLFALQPLTACRVDHQDRSARLYPITGELRRGPGVPRGRRLEYVAYSPHPESFDGKLIQDYSGISLRLRERVLQGYLQLPAASLPRLIEFARDTCGDTWREAAKLHQAVEQAMRRLNGESQSSTVREAAWRELVALNAQFAPLEKQMARRLVARLRDSGEFSYSLNASIQDATIDPVEDFLFNRKAAHCEYYASALALMLRAVGIPSRLISGFAGGTRQAFSNTFVVEQRHAHAWVEAYVADQWIILDATPAARNASVESMSSNFDSLLGLSYAASMFWTKYVTGMTLNHQQRNYYRPLQTRMRDIWEKTRAAATAARAEAKAILSSPRRWFSWQGFVVVFVLSFTVCGLVWCTRRLRTWWHLAWPWSTRRGASGTRVEFYERFRALLATRGLTREPSATHREFAVLVQHKLKPTLMPVGIGDVPAAITNAFYRVRFGAELLSTDEKDQLEQLLTHLEQSLSNHQANGQPAYDDAKSQS